MVGDRLRTGGLRDEKTGPIAPLIMGFILGPLMEKHVRASMQGSGGSPLIFLQRPFCAAFIVPGLLLILMSRRLYTRVPVQEETEASE